MTAFNNEKYKEIQKREIFDRINKFGKIYVEVGGKIFDDYHASRVLPGFESNVKMQIFRELKNELEIIFCINANDIISGKQRIDNTLTYSEELLRIAKCMQEEDIHIAGIVINFYKENELVKEFIKKCNTFNIITYKNYFIEGYPQNIDKILSDDGFGRNEYVPTSKKLVLVSAPGANSGKLQTCLSQMYNDKKYGINSAYAKYETFPVWNLAIDNLVNIAYEMATIDIGDYNEIDNYYKAAHNGKIAINYNRDLESFPILAKILNEISGQPIYDSPTSMGINKVGFAIEDDFAVQEASYIEIQRRHQHNLEIYNEGKLSKQKFERSELIFKKATRIYNNLKKDQQLK